MSNEIDPELREDLDEVAEDFDEVEMPDFDESDFVLADDFEEGDDE